ncbi:hypothetical protein [Thermomonas carbonis]|uniref:Uncharacterized protein n=1 Tax=Thermomonas carbonis TaxID=1463158 RepID=A0A7G9SNC8_9GAMM|nr:hypothetical protein [Thermomonas carbonis]QNN69353.1 hypothetical protein H9L16_11795 [Thermomonas carbonis]
MSIFVIVPAVLLLIIILTRLLQWLWNMTIPLAFDGGRKIEFLVAFRLLLIGVLLSSGGMVSCSPSSAGAA